MKVGNYTFELKKFKFIASLSEETYCFSAILYVNDRKFADCDNRGCGGPTEVDIFPECKLFGKEIEDFLKTQPPIKYENPKLELNLNLEYIVDELVQKQVEAKELQKMKNRTKNNLVFKTEKGDYFAIGWKKYTLESLLKTPQGQEVIRENIANEIAKRNVLINENIPSELLQPLPLSNKMK